MSQNITIHLFCLRIVLLKTIARLYSTLFPSGGERMGICEMLTPRLSPADFTLDCSLVCSQHLNNARTDARTTDNSQLADSRND